MIFYIRQWLQIPGAVDAAPNDLALHHKLATLKKGHQHYSNAQLMLKKLNAHLWYLSEELVFFYLFSIVTSLQRLKRKNCAKAMLKCWSSTREEAWSRRGKLVMPELNDKTYPGNPTCKGKAREDNEIQLILQWDFANLQCIILYIIFSVYILHTDVVYQMF